MLAPTHFGGIRMFMFCPAVHDPERSTFALQVLKVVAAFGIAMAVIDYEAARPLLSAEDISATLIAASALYFSRNNRYSRLPLEAGIGLLLYMCLVGIFQIMPQHLENSVWACIFPFIYFYLAGLRTGMWLSVLCAAAMPVSYVIFPLFSNAPRITPYSLLQIIGAFLLAIVFAYKYEKIRTQQESMLRHSAECDPLTGLLNRRGFADLSHAVVRHAMSSQQSFAVVLIDIDDFKQVNDSQGHEKGDQLLREIAALLQRHSRSTDLIARWGGEEFILLLAHTDLQSAHAVAEKIRAAISEYSFTTGGHTASLGIAIHDQNEPLEATINRADHAMYQAKFNGKNKVAFLTPQPA